MIFRLLGPRRAVKAPPQPALSGPVTEEYVRELQKRLAEKRAAAIAELGDRWLLHPSNRIR